MYFLRKQFQWLLISLAAALHYACESQDEDLNSLLIIKLYGLTVKTKYFQHVKLSVERVRIS